MSKSALEVVGPEVIRVLRESGFVVVESQPTESMRKAGASLGSYHYFAPEDYWHRMVGQSIKDQQAALL